MGDQVAYRLIHWQKYFSIHLIFWKPISGFNFFLLKINWKQVKFETNYKLIVIIISKLVIEQTVLFLKLSTVSKQFG